MNVVLASVKEDKSNLSWNSDLSEEYIPPCGIGSIATYLNLKGHNCHIIDGQVNNYTLTELKHKIFNTDPQVVGLTGYTFDRLNILKLADMLKNENRDINIVLGGPHFGQIGEETLTGKDTVDYVIKGEGEKSLCSLLDHLQGKRGPEEVAGLVYRGNGRVLSNPIKRLTYDEIPDIDWSLYELEKYKISSKSKNGLKKAIGISSARGCPNKCVYCYNSSFWGQSAALMPPKRFVNQLEYLNKTYGYRYFDILDDTFTVNKKRVYDICDEILKRKLKINWYIKSRVDNVNKNLLKKMRRSGCIKIFFGVESGSDRVLKRINKGIEVEKAIQVIKMSSDMDYYVTAFFMYSHPGETLEDVKKTFDVIRKIKKFSNRIDIYLYLCVIFPGTELEMIAINEGIIKPTFSWNDPVRNHFYKLLFIRSSQLYYHNRDLPIWKIVTYGWLQTYGYKGMLKKIGSVLARRNAA